MHESQHRGLAAHVGAHQQEGGGRADQHGQQAGAHALALETGIDVDRILDGPLVGHAGAVGVGVGIPRHLAVDLGDQVGEATVDDVAHAAQHLGRVRNVVLVGVDEVGHLDRKSVG
ncbi:hypothetical protein G6F23_015255 [Rhizopus arrhizus]|nr:hypothetical protein G6F23_015255 [Rhizopus arrhizus]